MQTFFRDGFMLLSWLWCLLFLVFLDDQIGMLAYIAAGLLLGFGYFFCWRSHLSSIRWISTLVLLAICISVFATMVPRHNREWGLAQSKLPKIEFSANQSFVTISNIRSNRHNDPNRVEYFDATIELAKIRAVWFGVDRFTSFQPVAHTFLSFELESGEHPVDFLAFSIETRREKDELNYSPLRGMFNNYETIYVIADEEDVLSVRSNIRENVVQLYPVAASAEQAKIMFVDLLERAKTIERQPEFYNTITNNCTNNIVYHANKCLDEPISFWQRGVVFPGYADWLAYQHGLIATDLDFQDAREEFRVDQRVKEYDGNGNFSDFIRGRE
ncbi:MAG: DUF4105 domain-containing protein [Planctomycetota bacterium]